MRIALGQMDCRVGDVAANVATMAALAQRAAEQQCDVVVFPEMSDVGYDMKAIHEHAASWEDGPSEDLRRIARDRGIAIIAGMSNRRGSDICNAAAVIDATGTTVASYRKIHLFSYEPICEDQHLAGGDDLCRFDLAGWPCGMMICYDLRFPELARALAIRGARVLFVVAAWPAARIGHWKLLNVARAVENQLYVVAVNRAGTDGTIAFGGASSVIGPKGEAIADTPGADADLLMAELDAQRIDETRRQIRVFDDRRPELYVQWALDEGKGQR